MARDLNENDKKLISLNIKLSIIGMLVSVLPSVFVILLSLATTHPLVGGGYSNEKYITLIPLFLYLFWIIILIFGISSKKANSINLGKIILFSSNLVLTITLFAFYLFFIIQVYI